MNWDKYSDQPYVDMDPKKKRRARLVKFDEMLKILFLGIFLFPLGLLYGFLAQKFFSVKSKKLNNFFGIGVNLDKYPGLTPELIDELGVKALIVRIPLWEIEKIDDYVEFVKSLGTQDLTIVLMQSREIVEDGKKLKNAVQTAFEKLSAYTDKFQFGIAINRYKWGYYTTDEYLKNLEVVESVRKNFPQIKLFGSSVIDFEYLLTIRTLFNLFKYKFDGVASLLYVDRRGAPENRQMGLNLIGKIEFLYFLVKLSFKSKTNEIYITETNWPLKDGGKYLPTSNDEAIEEDVQRDYLVRYYLLALGTGRVEKVFWHQLFSPGFGLVDFREGIRKREAYFAFKTLIGFLENSTFLFHIKMSGEYKYSFDKEGKKISVWWCMEPLEVLLDNRYNYYNVLGEEIKKEKIIFNFLICPYI